MKYRGVFAALVVVMFSAAGGRADSAAAAPQLFAPNVISGPANDGAPSFEPDGKTLFFTRSGSGAGTILESHFAGGHWTVPQIAPFSGEWNDQHAAVAPDGSFLVFTSTRPVPGLNARGLYTSVRESSSPASRLTEASTF